MSQTQIIILWIYAILMGIWPVRYVALIFIFKRLHRLTPASPRFSGPDFPLVSAIIPAKDEQDRIGATVTAARALPGVEVVIVCDDGSSDATASYAAAAGAIVVVEASAMVSP